MPRRIDVDEARLLLRSREKLLAAGLSERGLRDRVLTGSIRRLHRGSYVDEADWLDLWPEGRHLLRVLAVRAASPGAGPVFSQVSAAVIWGLPLFGMLPRHVHTLITGSRHTRRVAGVARHDMHVDPGDIVERLGLLCTSPSRTVFDVARTQRPEATISVADAALRAVAVRDHGQDADAAAAWREELAARAIPGLRGVRQARWVTAFADGRAQLPGESVSRLQLLRLGFNGVELQIPVTGAEGDQYYLDFAFRRSRAFGEFDGEAKYLEPDLRRADTAWDAVLAEKRREDDIRGVTGWSLARWGSAHIRTPDALGARLAAFGIRPPG